MSRSCKSCAGPISWGTRTGLCRECVKKDPETLARRADAIRRAFQLDPALRDRQRAHLIEVNRRPESRARSGQQASAIRLWEHGHAAITPEVRARQVKTMVANRLAGIPEDVRGLYQELTKVRRLPAPEAREIALAHHEATMARFRRSLVEGIEA